MKGIAATRAEQLERIVHAKRRIHPELRRPLNWSGFNAVCEREDVQVVLADIRRAACLFSINGSWAIAVRRQGVRQLWPGAHELGHLWAHVDQEPIGRFEATYYMDSEWADDPREEEADHIATLLMLGPRRIERWR